jgi:hypothetical protein
MLVVSRTTENLRAPWWHVGQRVSLEVFVFVMVKDVRVKMAPCVASMMMGTHLSGGWFVVFSASGR